MKTLMCAMLTLTGCAEFQKPAESSRPRSSAQIHRFIPVRSTIPAFSGIPLFYLAIDSATGSLCRTWDFHYNNEGTTEAVLSKTLPTCMSLTEVGTYSVADELPLK